MKKEKLLISACLLGVGCRYDGRRVKKINETELGELVQRYELIPFCPEIYGGLPTPRIPSEIVGDKVIAKDGTDRTAEYRKGGEEALSLCKSLGIKLALLKERSPSCGKGWVYDGSFSGTLTEGDGITAGLLKEEGIAVFGESELSGLLE